MKPCLGRFAESRQTTFGVAGKCLRRRTGTVAARSGRAIGEFQIEHMTRW